MLAKRIIPCLDVTGGRVVKGVNFVNLRDAGDPVELADRYNRDGADELVFLDITASSDDRETMVLDQTTGDSGAGAVEFGCAMARLAEQHHAGGGKAVERAAEGRVIDGLQRLRRLAYQAWDIFAACRRRF